MKKLSLAIIFLLFVVSTTAYTVTLPPPPIINVNYLSFNSSSFLNLSDVPHSYTGFADDCIAVNSTEDGLFFKNCSSGLSFGTVTSVDVLTPYLYTSVSGPITSTGTIYFNESLLNSTIDEKIQKINTTENIINLGFNTTTGNASFPNSVFATMFVGSWSGASGYLPITDQRWNYTAWLNGIGNWTLDKTSYSTTAQDLINDQVWNNTNKSVDFKDVTINATNAIRIRNTTGAVAFTIQVDASNQLTITDQSDSFVTCTQGDACFIRTLSTNSLDMSNLTSGNLSFAQGQMIIRLNTTVLPACNVGTVGAIAFNFTLKKHVGCNTTHWVPLY